MLPYDEFTRKHYGNVLCDPPTSVYYVALICEIYVCSERSKTDFDQAKIKLTGPFDRRYLGRYSESWFKPLLNYRSTSDEITYNM